MADTIREALQHLADWQAHCLNYGKPEKLARTIPTDDDLCELFNRLDRARRVLAGTPKARHEVTSRIYLTGQKPGGYKVRVGGFDGNLDIEVQTARAGHAIVRGLRDEAARRPDLFRPKIPRQP